MWTSLTLCVAAAVVGAVSEECTACIDGQCYHKHHLPEVSGYAMDIDRNTNKLYVIHEQTLSQCELDTGRCNNITDAWDIRGLTVDQLTGDIYGKIKDATGYSLYKLNPVSHKKKLLILGGVNYITFKDKLHFSAHKGIFSYEDGETRIVTGTRKYHVYQFIFDKKDDVCFRSYFNGDYAIRKLSKGAVDRSIYWDTRYWITVDKDGNAVFIHMDLHAVYRETDGQLVEVGAIDDSIYHNWYYTPLFDRDNNVIYRNNSQDYFHLKRNIAVNCTISILQNTRIITEIVVNTENYNDNDLTTRSSPDDSGRHYGGHEQQCRKLFIIIIYLIFIFYLIIEWLKQLHYNHRIVAVRKL